MNITGVTERLRIRVNSCHGILLFSSTRWFIVEAFYFGEFTLSTLDSEFAYRGPSQLPIK